MLNSMHQEAWEMWLQAMTRSYVYFDQDPRRHP